VLPAAARLRRRDEFTAVVRRGRRAASGVLVVHLLEPSPGAALAPAKAGFLVGRVVGNAVLRNQTRRRLRHLTSARLGSMPEGCAVVVRALPGASEKSFAELECAFDVAWQRLRPRTPASS
jgi:ribonuclease P protein component